jgi:hypothetical protein
VTGEFAFEEGGEGVDLASVVEYPPDAAVEAEASPELAVHAAPCEGITAEEWQSTQAQLEETRGAVEYMASLLEQGQPVAEQ